MLINERIPAVVLWLSAPTDSPVSRSRKRFARLRFDNELRRDRVARYGRNACCWNATSNEHLTIPFKPRKRTLGLRLRFVFVDLYATNLATGFVPLSLFGRFVRTL